MLVDISIPQFLENAFYNNVKYSIIASGRRTGKTMNAVQWMIEMLLDNQSNGLWVDTVQGNLDAYVKRYFKPILKEIWHLCYYNERKGYLELPNGSYIDLRSAQKPENMEGFEYQYVVINEAGIVFRKQELWYNTIYPMTKGDKTRVKIIGTPKGKNLMSKLAVQAKDNPDYKFYKFSAYESPFWNKKELNKIKQIVPEEVFRQEYMAEFVDGGGNLFKNLNSIIRNETLEFGKPNAMYSMGVDLAKHQDFTVITVVDTNTRQCVYIERFNQLDWSLQKQKIVNVWQKFNRAEMIIDSTGVGDSIFDDLVSHGINVTPFKFTNSSKLQLIRNLVIAFENKEIFIPNNEDLINELEMFEIQTTPSGQITYNAPEGMHDDCVISLALTNHLLHNVKELIVF